MAASGRTIVGMLIVAGLAIAFWVVALSPKRQEASDLSSKADALQAQVSQAQGEVASAKEARRTFPDDYQQLVLLGKAVPQGGDASSLLVELDQIANRSKVDFDSILAGDASATSVDPTATTSPTTASVPGAEVPPTEAAAALLPIGASIGTAGLGVVPYNLTFSGSFSNVADFIQGVDGLVSADGTSVAVDGHLLTINGFSLGADPKVGLPRLNATFSVNAYVTPPDQGPTAGATPTAPAVTTTTTTPTATAPTDTSATPTAAVTSEPK